MITAVQGAWPMFHQNAQHTGLSRFPGPTVPALEWKFQTGGSIAASPAIGHGRIYVTSEDGNLYALNSQGVLLWKFQTNFSFTADRPRTTPAIGSDGTIYLGGTLSNAGLGEAEGILYAINPGGKLKWSLTMPPIEDVGGFLSPTLGPDGTIYVSDFDFRVLAVHPDGTVKWSRSTYGEVWGSPALAFDGTVYVGIDDPDPTGACGQCLMAINPDGSIKWTDVATRNIQGPSPAVGSDGTVYVGTAGFGALFAINPDGTVKWESPGGSQSSPSIGPDGTIYAAGGVGMEAFYPNGTLRWAFPTGSSVPTDATVDSNGVVYFGSDASLYAVSPNGALLWKFAVTPLAACASLGCTSASISDPAIGPGGTIFVGSGDGNLYAIG
jgi:outer membrane protein assembly factor BamB